MWHRKLQDVWRLNPKTGVGAAVAAITVLSGLIVLSLCLVRARMAEARNPAPAAESARPSVANKAAPTTSPDVGAGAVKRQAAPVSHRQSLAARHTAGRKAEAPATQSLARTNPAKSPLPIEPELPHPPINPELAGFQPSPELLIHGPQ